MLPAPKPPTLAYNPRPAEEKRKRTLFILQFLCAFFAYYPLMVALTYCLGKFHFGLGSLFSGPLFALFPGIAIGAVYRGVLFGTLAAAGLTLLLVISLFVWAFSTFTFPVP